MTKIQLAARPAVQSTVRPAAARVAAESKPGTSFDLLRAVRHEPRAQIARDGVMGHGERLPHLDRIQAAFGKYDLRHVRAFIGGDASGASQRIGALAYTIGDRVAFRSMPDLRLAAHEAAHVVQQRVGVQLVGGFGRKGDPYERHADDVAYGVVQGRSVEHLLNRFHASTAGTGVQAKCACGGTCDKCNEIVQLQAAEDDKELDREIETTSQALEHAPPGVGEPLIAKLQALNARDAATRSPPARHVLNPTPMADVGCTLCHAPATAQKFPFSTSPPPSRGPKKRNIAMHQGIESEKWDERVEYNYKKLGDFRRARLIRSCRENGAVVCAWLMTNKEAWQLYNRAKAYARYIEMQRSEAAFRASALLLIEKWRGPQRDPKPQAVPKPRQPPRANPRPRPEPTPEPSPIADPTAIIVQILAYYIVSGLLELAHFGQYQQVLRQLGYEILEDPLGVCIGGCHYSAPRPDPFPDPLPGPEPDPEPDPDPKRRRRVTPTLWLPSGKYRHVPLYASYVRMRRLASDPTYDRPDTDQSNDWRRAMDPERGGLMVGAYYALGLRLMGERLGCDPESDSACRGAAARRVLLPTWNRMGTSREQPFPLFAVDHIIELQVGALLPLQMLDSIANWELLEYRMNSAVGSQLKRNIQYERLRLLALDPNGRWLDRLLVFEELAPLGIARADYWEADEVSLGRHIDVLRDIMRGR